jgi:hypothetical protein
METVVIVLGTLIKTLITQEKGVLMEQCTDRCSSVMYLIRNCTKHSLINYMTWDLGRQPAKHERLWRLK